MELFKDNDDGYLTWLAQHRSGLVVNTWRTPSEDYLVLHRSTCGSISTGRRRNYTTGGYLKVCADTIEELESWARGTTGGALQACKLCRPDEFAGRTEEWPSSPPPDGVCQLTERDVIGFRYWIQGYQKFYEPIVLAHFRDLGYEATKENSHITKADLERAARKLEEGSKVCGLDPEEKQQCIAHLRNRSRILTDGLLRKKEGDTSLLFTLESKSWSGFCSAESTLNCFLGLPGWFMLVDRLRGEEVDGSVLVVGGTLASNPSHEAYVRQLSGKYGTNVEIYYLDDIFATAGKQARRAIKQQIDRLNLCVKLIQKQVAPWLDTKGSGA